MDRRRDERIPVDLDVEVHCEIDGMVAIGRCLDLSRGGMYVRTHEELKPGTPCRVRVQRHSPPILTPMSLWGEIARSDAGGLGVRFDGSDRELASFVASLFDPEQGRVL